MKGISTELNEIQVVNIRMVREPSLYSEAPIRTPQDVLKAVANELASYDREVFAVLNLKTNGQIINMNICSMGTLNASLVSPREVLKSSILSNAASFICVHNHPSGELRPSEEDFDITDRLTEAGELLDIRCRDHIIVAGGTGEIFSFRENGMMNEILRGSRDYLRERE